MTRLSSRSAAVVGVLLTLLPALAAAQGVTGTLRGIVRNETGRPIEHALVTLDATGAKRETRTDRDGRFAFLGASPGAHSVRVNFVGYRAHDRVVQVPLGVIEIDVILEHLVPSLPGVEVTARRSGLYGSVIAKDSLLPVQNARVEIIGARTSDTTDAGGVFNFPKLKAGSYMVRVRHPMFESRNVSIVVPSDGATQLDLVVERGILSRDAHMEQLYREMDQRLHWAGTTSAMISREELKGAPTTGLDASIIATPGFMKASFYPAREGWENACLFVDGIARPGMTISDFPIEEIEAVEIYGQPINRSDPTGTLASRWPKGGMCGFASGRRPPGGRPGGPGSLSSSALRIQFVMIWLRH